MENTVHTPIRHIGYHNTSKSQVNILSSPSLISNNKIFETDVNNDNQRKENFKKLIDVMKKNIMFLKTKSNAKISGDDYPIKLNKELKKKNENLRKTIRNLENNNNYDDDYNYNFELNQNSSKKKIDFLIFVQLDNHYYMLGHSFKIFLKYFLFFYLL